MRLIPLGIINYDELVARMKTLATLKPEYTEAFTALASVEDEQLLEAWMDRMPSQSQTQLRIED